MEHKGGSMEDDTKSKKKKKWCGTPGRKEVLSLIPNTT